MVGRMVSSSRSPSWKHFVYNTLIIVGHRERKLGEWAHMSSSPHLTVICTRSVLIYIIPGDILVVPNMELCIKV
ncbi:Protein CBG25930 [Caenorhabditis briggsae]|uniref:Protein CBG25930 n=1 Tax=Caenorhabditis briggsae TaxID=6238 RepID=B6IK62_CAEBR|nr:Protein CBG25930 [Caenorhabditis briggsae]CAS00292.1 Protein CBG25930 [Caenorhabditis briggsae]